MCHRQSFSPSVLRLPRWSTKKAHHPWNLLFIIFLIITQQATNSAGGCIQNLSATRQNAPSNLFYLPLLHLLLLSLFVNRLSAIVSLPFFAAFHLSLSIQCFSCTRVSLSVAVPLSVVVPVAVRSLSSVPFPIGQRSKGIQSRRSGNGSVKKKNRWIELGTCLSDGSIRASWFTQNSDPIFCFLYIGSFIFDQLIIYDFIVILDCHLVDFEVWR